MAEISPTLQALLLEQATAFMQDTRDRLALDGHDPIAFYRWSADRQYTDAARFANATRKEREAPKPRLTLEQLLTTQSVNTNCNTCDCVHCKPHLLAVHGNGCSGYHCQGTCIAVPLERCGRCAAPEHPDLISVTGPYRTCPACTDIIRN